MAVIVRRKIIVNDREIIMTPFWGEGKITKDDMKKAKKLDKYLEQEMKQIFQEMKEGNLFHADGLRKWHALGQKLSFVDNKSLVNAEDVNNGYIWLAIRQHCPTELLPRGTKRTNVGATTGARREGKKYDHLHYCYQCGKYRWKDIGWVGNWFNWITLMESPGLTRDPRVIPAMRQIVKSLGQTITKNEFRAFAKSLRKFFSTKEKYRDTSGVKDAEIKKIIQKSARESGIVKRKKNAYQIKFKKRVGDNKKQKKKSKTKV